jgi:hypothetical protein
VLLARAEDGLADEWCTNTFANGAAGVDGHAAVRLEGVDEVALVAAQGLVLACARRHQQVVAVGVEVAPAAGDLDAAMLPPPCWVRRRSPGLPGPCSSFWDEVDHAADRVGAVDRRSAVLQHFDALDRRHRDRIQVDRRALHAVGRHAAAVQQDQGRVGALAAQVGRARAVVAALGAGGDVGVRRQVVGTVAVDVQVGDQLLGGDDALVFQLLAADDFERQRAFLGDALDALPVISTRWIPVSAPRWPSR